MMTAAGSGVGVGVSGDEGDILGVDVAGICTAVSAAEDVTASFAGPRGIG